MMLTIPFCRLRPSSAICIWCRFPKSPARQKKCCSPTALCKFPFCYGVLSPWRSFTSNAQINFYRPCIGQNYSLRRTCRCLRAARAGCARLTIFLWKRKSWTQFAQESRLPSKHRAPRRGFPASRGENSRWLPLYWEGCFWRP